MSEIQRRTIFVGAARDGLFRLCDWARVSIQGFGTLYEPRQENRHKTMSTEFDWASPDGRIDVMESWDPYGPAFADRTIGGWLSPQAGI